MSIGGCLQCSIEKAGEESAALCPEHYKLWQKDKIACPCKKPAKNFLRRFVSLPGLP